MLDTRLLKGRSQYKVPDSRLMKKISDNFIYLDQEKLLQNIAGEEGNQQGKVSLNCMYEK